MSHHPLENQSHDVPAGWTDSPWLWFGLFAAIGIIALAAVAPKYARRQGRLEQRYENRLRTQEQRQAAATGATADPVANSSPTRMGEARATTSLVPIALALLVGFALAALFVRWRTRRRHVLHTADGS